jgi:hypothetical protein
MQLEMSLGEKETLIPMQWLDLLVAMKYQRECVQSGNGLPLPEMAGAQGWDRVNSVFDLSPRRQ